VAYLHGCRLGLFSSIRRSVSSGEPRQRPDSPAISPGRRPDNGRCQDASVHDEPNQLTHNDRAPDHAGVYGHDPRPPGQRAGHHDRGSDGHDGGSGAHHDSPTTYDDDHHHYYYDPPAPHCGAIWLKVAGQIHVIARRRAAVGAREVASVTPLHEAQVAARERLTA
jgi:hypothetical protein